MNSDFLPLLCSLDTPFSSPEVTTDASFHLTLPEINCADTILCKDPFNWDVLQSPKSLHSCS